MHISFFWYGFIQPWQAPTQALAFIGLGLLLGQQGKQALRFGIGAFFLSISLGLLLTRWVILAGEWEIPLLAVAGLMGVLLALRLAVPLCIVTFCAGTLGLLASAALAPNLMLGSQAFIIKNATFGVIVSATLTVLLSAAVASYLRIRWEGLVLRVLGSWLVASTLMVLAMLLFAHHH
ncbi:MAG: hypothetical protein L3K52_01215 [Candidatus Thiothrix sulfatifontis]|nr:MAG: hypothetical protein L3K52_01215 [Candidatus Thiothrix sulfatifontis]